MPYNIQNKAMNDLLKGYTSNFATKCKFWDEYSFLHKINSAKSFPKQYKYNSCLVINHLGEFYLSILEPLKIKTKNQSSLFLENQEKI
ncbi:hypothetical protein C2G38_2162191 [Gigaspora rosea]|uniref:Uncharacterized protein n=1 Tax=Gigaspora rosea TaxID=44941 RepID=A0A397W0N3_9GLOM|nr:hypothetical protein C2G38_2162191 [Gigaspora rosea]